MNYNLPEKVVIKNIEKIIKNLNINSKEFTEEIPNVDIKINWFKRKKFKRNNKFLLLIWKKIGYDDIYFYLYHYIKSGYKEGKYPDKFKKLYKKKNILFKNLRNKCKK